MIRIAICDDEKKILDEVAGYIESYSQRKGVKDIEAFRFDSASALIGVLEDSIKEKLEKAYKRLF